MYMNMSIVALILCTGDLSRATELMSGSVMTDRGGWVREGATKTRWLCHMCVSITRTALPLSRAHSHQTTT